MEMTPIQQELCVYFNNCHLKYNTNPITMALYLTKKYSIEKKEKKCLGRSRKKKKNHR